MRRKISKTPMRSASELKRTVDRLQIEQLSADKLNAGKSALDLLVHARSNDG
jgi:hypothetical protein